MHSMISQRTVICLLAYKIHFVACHNELVPLRNNKGIKKNSIIGGEEVKGCHLFLLEIEKEILNGLLI